MRSGSTLVTETIGDLSPRPTMPRRRETSDPAAPMSCSSASSSASLAPLARSDSAAMMPCEWPAIATGGVPYRSRPCLVSARIAAIWASRMPGPEIAAVISCLVAGSGSSAASARTHCRGSKPIGRTTTSSRATGSRSSAASPTTSLSSDSMPAELTSSSRFSNQEPPWPPNATAYGSPAFNRSTRAYAEENPPVLSMGSFSRPVVTLLCSLIVTSCYLPRYCLARSSLVGLWLSYLELLMACAPLRRPCDSASNPDWFRRVRRTGHPTVLSTARRTLQPY